MYCVIGFGKHFLEKFGIFEKILVF